MRKVVEKKVKKEFFKDWLLRKGYYDTGSVYEEIMNYVFEEGTSKSEPPGDICIRLKKQGIDARPVFELFKKWQAEKNQEEKEHKGLLPHNRMAKGEASKYLECLKYMPELPHSKSEAERFDITDSEVVKWLTKQPEILQYLFIRARNSGNIVYNQETHKWSGKNQALISQDKRNWTEGEF